MATETELKLALAPAAIPALLAHPLLATAPPRLTRLANTYYDTPDLALLARRFAIRLRRDGRRRLVTVKGEARAPGGLSRRAEWETEVPGDALSFDHVDAPELRSELTALLPTLTPVFSTDFRRHTWRVQRGVSTIEVAFDRGRIEAVPAGRDPGQAVREAICEVELELLEGQDDDLLALAEALAATLPLLPAPASKAERGYRLYRQEHPGPVKLRNGATSLPASAQDAFCDYAFACLENFNRNVAGFLAAMAAPGATRSPPAPEFIHQARVALRRLRSALELFAAALPDDYVARWQSSLADLADALSPARDWQVLAHDTWPQFRALLPPRQATALARRLAAQERQALATVRSTLADPATTRLTLGLLRTTLTLAAPGNNTPRPLPLPHLARRVIRRAVKQVERRVARLNHDLAGANSPNPEAYARDWHRLRIAIKRLRYGLDVLRPLLRDKDVQCWIDHLLPLQDALGALNDSAVGITRLRALSDTSNDPLTAPAIAWLDGRTTGLHQTLPHMLGHLFGLTAPRLKKSSP